MSSKRKAENASEDASRKSRKLLTSTLQNNNQNTRFWINEKDYRIVRDFIRDRDGNLDDFREEDVPAKVKSIVKIREDDPERRVHQIDINGTEIHHSTLRKHLRALKNLSGLKYLSCHFRRFGVSYFAEIGKLQNLTELYLKGREAWGDNYIELPEAIGQLTSLKRLNIDDINILWLPPAIGRLRNLEFFFLRGTKISELPRGFGRLANLKTLKLEETQIRSLPRAIGNLKSLEVLYLKSAYNAGGLPELPDEIGGLASLKKLVMYDNWYNHDMCLPPSIGRLKKLEEIRLSVEGFLKLPDEIGGLSSLKTLDLTHTRIKLLPPTIGSLPSLEFLNLSYTRVVDLPGEIGGLVSLKRLVLKGTHIVSLPPTIGSLPSLEFLNLSYTRVVDLPDEIGGLSSLKTLDLTHTRIKLLPPTIGRLKNLEELDLLDTKYISELPGEIWGLTSLKELNFSRTSIKSLPPTIGKLKNLEELDLCGLGHLSNLPDEIGGLTSLKRLYLNSSKLTSLPSSIGRLTNVEYLFLNETETLEQLPVEIGDLKKLKILGLRHSAVLQNPLPEFLGKLTGLLKLQIFDNPYDNSLSELCLRQKESLNLILRRCQWLGSLGFWSSLLDRHWSHYHNDVFDNLCSMAYTLSLNRARARMKSVMDGNDSIGRTSKLWPLMLRSARCAQKVYNHGVEGADSDPVRISRPDAVYHLLIVGRESFIGVLLRRKR